LLERASSLPVASISPDDEPELDPDDPELDAPELDPWEPEPDPDAPELDPPPTTVESSPPSPPVSAFELLLPPQAPIARESAAASHPPWRRERRTEG
jgi:hypothetical protein